jgi:diguanylate cyclase (GGDEF)-like protein/PAS domain S-box-containing protein
MPTRRILAVACERDVAFLEGMLEAQGYAVTGVTGSADEIRALGSPLHADLALVALGACQADEGLEVSRMLRESLGLPVVFLVEEWTPETWSRAKAQEPAGYVTRPIRSWDLMATLELALTGHRRRVRRRGENEQYRTLFDQNVAGVFRKTRDGVLRQCNQSFARMFGYDEPSELVGQSMSMLYASPSDRESFLERLDDRGAVTNYELPMHRQDGTPIWVLENAALLTDPETEEQTVIGTLIDITERKTLETHLKELAHQDPLTGLANRRALEARAEHAIELAVRRKETGALLFIDLVRFKEVNDTLGHRAGDEVLVETAARLRAALRSSDTAARVGGDEFVVLLSDVDGAAGARTAAQRILDQFDPVVEVEGQEVEVRIRVGVALFPSQARALDELMGAAGKVVSDLKPETGSVLRMYENGP